MDFRTNFIKGFWAIADQGLFAVTNFILNVLLARWLSVDEYGLFATLFSIFLLLSTVQTALITEPMLVLGPKINSNERLGYLIQANKLNLIFSLALIILLIIAAGGIYFWNSRLYVTTIVLALSTPMILFSWFGRRACYLFFAPKLAAFGGVIYLLIVVLMSVFIRRFYGVTIEIAFIIMGIAGFITGLLLFFSLYYQGNPNQYSNIVDVAKQHWTYGKWSLSTSGLYWIPRNFYFLFLPVLYGVYFNGVYKALSNLIMPALQVNTALGTLMIASFSRQVNKPALHKFVKLFSVVMLNISGLYYVGLLIFREPLLKLLYGMNDYASHSYLLVWMGLIPILTGGIEIAGALLRANERPKDIFTAYIACSLVTIIFGTILMIFWGLFGVILGIIVAYVVLLASMFFPLRRIGVFDRLTDEKEFRS